jgi:hypothetical protein
MCDLGDGSECVLAAYSVMEGDGTKKDGAARSWRDAGRESPDLMPGVHMGEPHG